jgi:hypothetical protein
MVISQCCGKVKENTTLEAGSKEEATNECTVTDNHKVTRQVKSSPLHEKNKNCCLSV